MSEGARLGSMQEGSTDSDEDIESEEDLEEVQDALTQGQRDAMEVDKGADDQHKEDNDKDDDSTEYVTDSDSGSEYETDSSDSSDDLAGEKKSKVPISPGGTVGSKAV